MILDIFKEEVFDINFKTRILELSGWDETSSLKILEHLKNSMEKNFKDIDTLSDFHSIKEKLKNDIFSHDLVDDLIVMEFFEYLDNMTKLIVIKSGETYEN